MEYNKKIVLITIIIFLVFTFSFNLIAKEKFRAPRINLQGNSEDGFTGQTSVLFPLKSRDDAIIYTDFRSRISNDTASEWNLGLGYRKKYQYNGEQRIGGVYLYKDRREEFNKKWDMITIGGEVLTESFDIRLNGYLTGNEKITAPYNDTVVVSDNKIIYQKGYYKSMDGIDFEMGKRFINNKGLFNNIGVYLKLYTFFAQGTDNIYGKEININKLVGNRNKTNYKFGIEWQQDNVRGSNLNAKFSVSIPFGESEVNKDEKNINNKGILESRMTDQPHRDIDIVIGKRMTGENVEGEIAYNPKTGNKLDDVKYMSAGNEEIVSKINQSNADVIILTGNKGIIEISDTIKLKKGQTLLSPTGSLIVSSDEEGNRATYFKPEGKQATLKLTSNDISGKGALVLERNNTVSGLKMIDDSDIENSRGIYKEVLDVNKAPDLMNNIISGYDIGIYFDEIKGETSKDKIKQLKSFNLEYEKHNTITDHSIVDVYDHIIKDWYDLDSVRYNLDGVYLMKANIGSKTEGYTEWEPLLSFSGYFDGQGYEISDLYINKENHVGLFGFTESGSVIENVGLKNVDVKGDMYVGGLVGENSGGTINNSYAAGDVEGIDYVGGLVGWNDGEINNSYATGTVKRHTDVGLIVGGLVGINSGEINNSYATVDVVGNSSVGGLVGINTGRISNSYATGDVVGNRFVGGLVGEQQGGDITSSYATVDVVGDNTVGGLVGRNVFGDITSSYATVDVVGDNKVGGLVGLNTGRISNSYATGNVTGNIAVGGLIGGNKVMYSKNPPLIEDSHAVVNTEGDNKVGGLVGSYQNSRTREPIDFIVNSYAAGDVTGSGGYVGGLVGSIDGAGLIKNSYTAGDVTGSGEYVGGLVGFNDLVEIKNSYATGAVTGSGEYVGGLVGEMESNIKNSYATGNVTGTDNVGGLVGLNEGGGISNSYAAGNVTGDTNVGGLVGINYAEVIDSISLKSQDYDVIGRKYGTPKGRVTEAPEADMQQKGLYTDDTFEGEDGTKYDALYEPWDDTIWDFGESDDYPKLNWQE